MSKSPENSQYKTSTAFSKRIKHLIYENECDSNTDLAKLIGVGPIIISNAVNYGIIPSTRTLIKIANKFDLSLKYLLGIDNINNFIPSANPSNFPTRIAQLTEENNLNYGKVASQTSFTRMYIYQWNKKCTIPSLDYLFEIADYFKVSPDYLLGRTDYRN
ncbi:MAG: helix-turn-helix domain-containing protein [Clostridia bacterium]|nr:helix-turn-helix domain-containing protein [Clostridia bacterium]